MILNQRVLIISPVATHPQNAGNSERVFQIAEALRTSRSGKRDVFFCNLNIPSLAQAVDKAAMERYWGKNWVFLETSWRPIRNAFCLKRNTSRLIRLFGMLQKAGVSSWMLERLAFLHSADMWFPPEFGTWLREFSKKWKPDIVVVEYALLSKAFEYVEGNPLRIIDTHDLFTGRNQRLRDQGIIDNWISFTAHQEKKLLQRADKVIAIQNYEATVFESMIGRDKVRIIDVLTRPIRISSCGLSPPVLGFLGSSNAVNRSALSWFLTKVWPRIILHNSNARLRVGGLVCEDAPELPGVEYLGEISDRNSFYADCRFMINPCLGGTGLKIKSVESLIYGRPLVTTSCGATGLELQNNKCLIIADDDVSFSKYCVELLESPETAERMGRDAWDYIETRLAQNISTLNDSLDAAGKNAPKRIF